MNWKSLATAVGARSTTVQTEFGPQPGLLTEGRGFDLLAHPLPGRGVYVQAVFTPGEDVRTLHDRLEQDPLLKKHLASTFREGTLASDAGEVQLLIPDWPIKEKGLDLGLLRLGTVLAAEAPERSRMCWGCSQNEAELSVGRDGKLARVCAACADQAADRKRRMEAEHARNALDEDELPPLPFPDMPFEELQAHRAKLEQDYERNPAAYTRKVLGMVLLGQGALVFGFLAAAALVVALVGGVLGGSAALIWMGAGILIFLKLLVFKLGKFLIIAVLAAGGAAAALLRATWSNFKDLLVGPPKVPEPEGVCIRRDEQPRFWAWLDDLSQKVGAPKVDRVFVTDDFNAFATERRRSRFSYERIVGIGVPFLELMSEPEVAGVMAHELGHLRHQDTRGRWVYRTAATWDELGRRMLSREEGGPMVAFAHWYTWRFLLLARVLGRAQELRADAEAAKACGVDAFATGEVKVSALGKAWRHLLLEGLRVRALQPEDSRVAVDPIELVHATAEARPQDIRRAYVQALHDEVHWLDTHPPMVDRLRFVGAEVPEVDRIDVSRPETPGSAVFDGWSALRKQVLARQVRLLSIIAEDSDAHARGLRARLDWAEAHMDRSRVADRVALARLLSGVDRDDDALALYTSALEDQPNHLEAAQERIELLTFLGRDDEAAASADAARELPKDAYGLRIAMVKAYLQASRHADAIAISEASMPADEGDRIRWVFQSLIHRARQAQAAA